MNSERDFFCHETSNYCSLKLFLHIVFEFQFVLQENSSCLPYKDQSWELISGWSENNVKPVNTLLRQNAEVLMLVELVHIVTIIP